MLPSAVTLMDPVVIMSGCVSFASLRSSVVAVAILGQMKLSPVLIDILYQVGLFRSGVLDSSTSKGTPSIWLGVR